MQHLNALVALREALSDCASDVDAQLRQGGEEGLTDRTLRRWLVARKVRRGIAARLQLQQQQRRSSGCNCSILTPLACLLSTLQMQVDVAAAHIKVHAAWRAAWAPAGRIMEVRHLGGANEWYQMRHSNKYV